jgi:hypothetical protein
MPSAESAAAPGSAAALFYAQQRSALLGDPSVTEKKMFGTTVLCAGGKVLLFSWRDTLMVKTPAAQVQDLVAAGAAEPSVAQALADGDDQGLQGCGDIIGVCAAVAVEVGLGVICGEPGQEGDAAGREPAKGFSHR